MVQSGQILGGAVSKTNRTVGVTVEGLSEVYVRLKMLGPQAVRSLGKAMYQEAEEIMGEAKEITPTKSGNLKGSGYVPPPKIGTDNVEVILGFGGDAEAYALPVHEIPPPPQKSVGGRSARHDPPNGLGGTWKYLETPFLDHLPGMLGRIAADVAADLGTS